ncbi:MAG: FeoB small GTPase domain-containing protein, partial [Actinomycetota bacterium]
MQLSCHSALNKLRGETDFTIALAGNPNVGKSSVFNSLTGMGVETAHYPGKTVELNVATTSLNGMNIGIIDLPGTYALGAVSEDQWVARQAVLDGNPDAVVMVVDATNLARNLYMVVQFLELGYPLVIALNILDVMRRQGRDIDIDRLSVLLGVPVVPTVANRGEGLDE